MGNKYKVGDILFFSNHIGEILYYVHEVTALSYRLIGLDATSAWADRARVGYISVRIPKHKIEESEYTSLAFDEMLEVKSELRLCNCEMLTLMRTGCACGGK